MHQRSHKLNATSNSLFKFNLWRLLAITWFFYIDVEVGWHLITLLHRLHCRYLPVRHTCILVNEMLFQSQHSAIDLIF